MHKTAVVFGYSRMQSVSANLFDLGFPSFIRQLKTFYFNNAF